jgi:malate synthase
VALKAFEVMTGPNQLDRIPEQVPGREAMLEIHTGPRTEGGARENIRVGVQYLAAWLSGRGAVPLYNLMEDAATAEICRTQLWQWLKFGAPMDDGGTFDRATFERLFDEEVGAIPDQPHLSEAAGLFRGMVLDEACEEFLTLPAYRVLA